MKQQPLKVLHVITGLNDGGAEGALYRLCVHDKRCKHVVVTLMGAGKYGPLLQEAGVHVHCLNMHQGRVTCGGVLQLWRLVRQYQPDVMQTWLYHADLLGGVAGRLAGLKNIAWGIRHSNLTPGTVKQSTIWTAKLCAKLSRWIPARIICCSEQAARSHVSLGYTAEKFRVIPNGYDLTRLRPDASIGETLRKELGLSKNIPLLGMVARFDIQKDHANLLTALGQLKRQGHDFHCVLVGAGMEPNNLILANWLAENDVADHVTLLGRRNDIHAIMNSLDVHVLSSLGEAFPNVLAEAMACGTPCVTTDVGDAGYIVGATGWVLPPQDSIALSAGISSALACLADSSAWQARQQAARGRIEANFTIERVSMLYDAMWRELAQL